MTIINEFRYGSVFLTTILTKIFLETCNILGARRKSSLAILFTLRARHRPRTVPKQDTFFNILRQNSSNSGTVPGLELVNILGTQCLNTAQSGGLALGHQVSAKPWGLPIVGNNQQAVPN